MERIPHPTHLKVQDAYGRIASLGGGCCGPRSSCCGGGRAGEVAQGVGYSDAELATLPEGANLGLSCGNPTALAELKPGETVLDLGSGAGLDTFLAAQRVGAEGQVHGVDMTREMLAKARHNAAEFRRRTGLDNVTFHQGQIGGPSAARRLRGRGALQLRAESESRPAHGLEGDRPRMKPGGRVSISDMVLLRPLPQAVRESVEALVGCVAGAAVVDDLRDMVLASGLVNLVLTPKGEAVEAMLPVDDPLTDHLLGLLPTGTRASDYVTSMIISAHKPA